MQLDFDVAVVGGSSAGICASLTSSTLGARTVLIEKKKVIGVPVRCGEFIPSKDVLKEMLPQSENVEKIYELIPREVVVNRIKSIRFYSPRNRCFEFRFDGLVLKRDLMEQLIANKTVEKGAQIYSSSIVTNLIEEGNRKKIVFKNNGEERTLSAKVVIGADGYPSNIARWAGMKTGYKLSDIALTVQNVALNVDGDDETVEMFTGNEYVPGGYGWIIPKGDKIANVGLGIRLSHMRTSRGMSIRDYLEAFIRRHPLMLKKLSESKLTSFCAKMVPAGGRMKEICRDDIILIGDAAGLVIPTNGSGIPTAMMSGNIAGQVVSEYLKGCCELDVYTARLMKEINPVIARGVAYRHVADWLMSSDILFDIILRLIGVGNVSKVLECKKSFWDTLIHKIF